MTLSEITSLRATCLQVALQEAQQGMLRTSVGARAAELTDWAMAFNHPNQPSGAVEVEVGASQAAGIAGAAPDAPASTSMSKLDVPTLGRKINVDRAYFLQTYDGEEWWALRVGSGESGHYGSIPQFNGRARLICSGRWAAHVSLRP